MDRSFVANLSSCCDYISTKSTIQWIFLEYFSTLMYLFNTVKPVFKRHADERTPCDQGMFSQNGVVSSQC